MEKRAILAAVLMAGLLIVYQALFFPSSQEPPAPQAPKTPAEAPREAPKEASPTPPPAAPAPAPRAERPRPTQRTVTVEAPLYHAVVSSEGGKLLEWTLKYRGSKPMVAVGEFGPAGLLVGADQRPPEVVPMEPSADTVTVDPGRGAAELVLRGDEEGLRVTGTYGFVANDFTIDARIRVDNPTSTARTATIALPWIANPPAKNATEKFLGQHVTEVVWSTGGHVERIENLAAVGAHTIDGSWIGVDST